MTRGAYVERFIGSVRRECLDHVIVCSKTGLCRTLQAYTACYQRSRTHLALNKDAPVSRPVIGPARGTIVAVPRSVAYMRSTSSTTTANGITSDSRIASFRPRQTSRRRIVCDAIRGSPACSTSVSETRVIIRPAEECNITRPLRGCSATRMRRTRSKSQGRIRFRRGRPWLPWRIASRVERDM